MRILIVEDDEDIRKMLVKNLKAESFAVDATADGERGSFLARTSEYDLIILDYLLPKKDGGEICTELRACGKTMPVLILSVNATPEEKIRLLNLGADDYMTKPFSYAEVVARIRALARRPRHQEPSVLRVGSLTVNPSNQDVLWRKRQIYLTRKEFALLEYLVRHPGEVLSRGMIMEHVWDMESDPFSNTVEAHVFNLRKKLSLNKCQCIYTVPGRGYRLEVHP